MGLIEQSIIGRAHPEIKGLFRLEQAYRGLFLPPRQALSNSTLGVKGALGGAYRFLCLLQFSWAAMMADRELKPVQRTQPNRL